MISKTKLTEKIAEQGKKNYDWQTGIHTGDDLERVMCNAVIPYLPDEFTVTDFGSTTFNAIYHLGFRIDAPDGEHSLWVRTQRASAHHLKTFAEPIGYDDGTIRMGIPKGTKQYPAGAEVILVKYIDGISFESLAERVLKFVKEYQA